MLSDVVCLFTAILHASLRGSADGRYVTVLHMIHVDYPLYCLLSIDPLLHQWNQNKVCLTKMSI